MAPPLPSRLAWVVALGSAAWLSDGAERSEAACHEPGECPAAGRGVARSGFTNNTGWRKDGGGCCDICEGAKRVNCFDKASCGAKTGKDDWDFLILDQIWLPQLCKALSEGHDPTLTHTQTARCVDGAFRRNGLSIHGLWPNYVGGYPQCCRHVDLPQDLHDAVVEQAEREWVDPTTAAGDGCGVCKMWAHEMMKHGTCLTTSMDSYMRMSLDLLGRLKEQTAAANGLLSAASRDPVPTKQIQDLFAPYATQMLCDPHDPGGTSSVGVFLEMRTCWNRTASAAAKITGASDLMQVDCLGKPVGMPCPGSIVADGSQGELHVLVL
mmetsp:Transcript_27689/g.56015  ORF Transcript_27689/g.56015 Transcript_27689/m.56015 type:complete len:324 (-) Transcript_27689:96-1067(-)